MRYAVLILAILGSLAAGALGLLWLLDKNSFAGQLIEALRRDRQFLDAQALSELQRWDRHVLAIWFLFAAVPLGLAGATLGMCRRGFCAATLLLLAVVGPAVLDWRSLVFTGLLLIAALLSCFVRRPQPEVV